MSLVLLQSEFGSSAISLRLRSDTEIVNKYGPVAEWLGSALQKLLQRFESARDLKMQTQSFENQVVAFFVSSFCRAK